MIPHPGASGRPRRVLSNPRDITSGPKVAPDRPVESRVNQARTRESALMSISVEKASRIADRTPVLVSKLLTDISSLQKDMDGIHKVASRYRDSSQEMRGASTRSALCLRKLAICFRILSDLPRISSDMLEYEIKETPVPVREKTGRSNPPRSMGSVV